MSQPFHTVADAAERLRLHPKTILRFIREGRLRATRVGRQYRILSGDLAALSGQDASAPAARATAIVDLAVEAETARALAAYLPTLRAGPPTSGEHMNIDLAYDPQAGLLKVVLIGAPADVGAMLSHLDAWLRR
jgi:excisionase family DNA binding protein